jgi:hypothetical protein
MIPLTTTSQVVTGAAQVVGLAVLAATIAAIITVSYRWVTREQVPVGLALLGGLAGVAVYVSATPTLGEVIGGETSVLRAALYNIVAFAVSAGSAVGGHRFGDGFARDVLFSDPDTESEQNVSELLETVGRVTVVDIPEQVDDVVGYDPVTAETKEALAGERFVFPQRLTPAEIDERVRSRIRTDYGVGTVDLELAPDGTVEHIGVGSNAAGIGPTLPPATNAVAIRADPAFDASTGDIVQVWESDSMRRVLTGELRGVAGDVVTVAINSADTPKVDPTREYRLVTLPVEDRPAREFASLLRAAEESFASVTVEAGSPLHGLPVGAVRPTIVSVRPEGSEPLALPSREYVLSAGDLVFAIGTPNLLRKLDRATEPLDPSVVSTTTTESRTTPEPTQTGDEEQAASEAGTDKILDQSSDEPGRSEFPNTPETTDSAPEPADSPSPPDQTDSGQSEPATAGKADQSSFDELKADYESGGDWDEDDEDESETQSIEELAGGDGGSDGTTDGTTSFDELKAEFESGDADWSDDTADESVAAEQSADEEGSDESLDDSDDLMSLDEADISFEDESEEDRGGLESAGFDDDIEDGDLDAGFDDDTEDGLDESDDLSSLDVDEAEDLSEIEMDESGGESLFDDDPFDDDSLFEEAEEPLADEDALTDDESETAEDNEDEEDEDDEADDSDEDDGDDSGGGTSFAQLKEEFESGDADWEDDVSDSPGGDMRLDE